MEKSPLHSRIFNEFHENYIMPELEKRKMALAQIRNFKQPIRLTEIRAHSAQKKELLKVKLQEFFLNKREFLANWSVDLTDKYKSKFWRQVKERESKENEDLRNQKDYIKDRQKKRIDYARNAMSIYKPKNIKIKSSSKWLC